MAIRRRPKNTPTSSNGCRGFLSIRKQRLESGRAAGSGGRFQRHSSGAGRPQSGRLGQRRPVSSDHARGLPVAARPRADRRAAGRHRRTRPIYLLGLSGRRLAEEPRFAHRSSAAIAAGQRPAHRCRGRQLRPRLGKAVGPCAGLGRSSIWRRRNAAPFGSALGPDQSRRPCTQCSSICSAIARSSSDALAIALL